MISGIHQFCNDYYEQIPAHSLKTIGFSAVTTFTVAVSFYADGLKSEELNFTRPFLDAGIVMVAATIHALITPIFNYLFDNNGVYNPYQDFFQMFISLTFTQVLMNRMTLFNVHLFGKASAPFSHQVIKVGIFVTSFLRIPLEIGLRISSNFAPPHMIIAVRSGFQNCGINFNQTTPIYIAI